MRRDGKFERQSGRAFAPSRLVGDGRGGGWNVLVHYLPRARAGRGCHPSPYPSPARGEGTKPVHHRGKNSELLHLLQLERVVDELQGLGAVGLVDDATELDLAGGDVLDVD